MNWLRSLARRKIWNFFKREASIEHSIIIDSINLDPLGYVEIIVGVIGVILVTVVVANQLIIISKL